MTGRAAGFDIERLAPDTLIVRAVPALLPREDVAALVRDVIGGVTEDGASHHLDGASDRLLGTIACRSAIHAHRRLTLPEMNASAAADGADAARRPVQSRPPHLDTGDAGRTGSHVPARPLIFPCPDPSRC
jgi:DNA mismatch repair ATPase MutL